MNEKRYKNGAGNDNGLSLLPCNPQAEQAVLGAVIQEGILGFANKLKPEDFYEPAHQTIFKAMQALGTQKGVIDFVLLCDHLKDKGDLEKAGGQAYIGGLIDEVPTTANLPYYVGVVIEKAVERKIIQKAQATPEELQKGGLTGIISDLRAFYSDLALLPSLKDVGFFDYEELLKEGNAYAQKGKATGIHELDKAVKIMPKELIIIGARSRHGKSSFAYNLLLNFLETNEEEAFILFNLDVPSTIAMSRMATIWASKHQDVSHGYKDVLPSFQTLQFPKGIVEAFSHFDKYGKEKRLAVVNTPRYTVEQLIAHAETLAKEKPLGAIFIDYIELIKTDKRHDTEELRISYIVNQLRIASETLSCPVIVLAQMNRSSAKEKTAEKRRPTLEGLRYSGRQEQEATTVLGLFNINAEKLETDQADGIFNTSTTKTALEIIPLKNRGGASNKIISLSFDMVSGYIYSPTPTGFNS